MRVQPCGEGHPLAPAGIPRVAGSEERLGADVGRERLRPAALGAVAPGRCQRQPGILHEERWREGVDPGPVTVDESRPVTLEQAVDRRPVLGPAERGQGLGHCPAGREELAGPVRLGPCARLTGRRDQHRLQVASQDLVVPKRALVIKRDREDAAPFELLEELPAARSLQERVAERTVQAAQHAGPDQEVAKLVGQLRDHVAGEVVAHEPGARTEAGQDPQPFIAWLAVRGEMEELEAGRPTLRPPGQPRELVRAELVAVEVTEEPLHFP